VAANRAFEKAKSQRVFGQARKPAKMFRAGLYARVSTNDQQTIPSQIRALREYAVRRDWTIALQVEEVGSGASERQLWEGYWRRRAVARSTWCWYGDWIGGADR
jgi:predicted site-specific integrase-resolvase